MKTQTRYRKLELLGSGGMGEVWLVHDEQLGCYWAMKLLKADSDKDCRNAFEQEIAVLTSLKHPAIPRIVERIQYEGQDGVIMDLVEGIALSEYKEMSEEAQLLDWAKQLLDILKHIHTQQILYLDLKPDNIMLDRSGRLHLIDFGIACFKEERNENHQRFGTIGYSPKEQFERTRLDERCDIYAFGKTMLSLATGCNTDQLRNLSAADTSLSQGFRLLLEGCIKEERSLRYDDVDSICRDIDKLHRLHNEIHIRKKIRKRVRCALFVLGSTCYLGAMLCMLTDHHLRLHRYDEAMRNQDYALAIAQGTSNDEPYQRLYENAYNVQLTQTKREGSLIDAMAQARSYSIQRMKEYQLDLSICSDAFLARMIQDALMSGDASLYEYAAIACEQLQNRTSYELLYQLCMNTVEEKPFSQTEQVIQNWLSQARNQKSFMEWGFLYAQLYELHALELNDEGYRHWQSLMERLDEQRLRQETDWLNEDMTRLLYLMKADSYYQYGRYLKTRGGKLKPCYDKLFAVNEAMKEAGYQEAQVLSQCGNACLDLFSQGGKNMQLQWLKQSRQYFESALKIRDDDIPAAKGLQDCERLMSYWGRI